MTIIVLFVGLILAAIFNSVTLAIITLAIVIIIMYLRQNWLHSMIDPPIKVKYDTEE